MNVVRVRIISEILLTRDHVHFGKWVFFTLFCPRSSAVAARNSELASIVDPAHLAKSLLAILVPFYIIYYIKETRYFLYHDESQDVLAVGAVLETVEEE
jgi:hypothetical protein